MVFQFNRDLSLSVKSHGIQLFVCVGFAVCLRLRLRWQIHIILFVCEVSCVHINDRVNNVLVRCIRSYLLRRRSPKIDNTQIKTDRLFIAAVVVVDDEVVAAANECSLTRSLVCAAATMVISRPHNLCEADAARVQWASVWAFRVDGDFATRSATCWAKGKTGRKQCEIWSSSSDLFGGLRVE